MRSERRAINEAHSAHHNKMIRKAEAAIAAAKAAGDTVALKAAELAHFRAIEACSRWLESY